MSIAYRVRQYLNNQQISYDVTHHVYSEGAVQTAIAAHVPFKNMAKAVVMEDHEGRHLMAVLPAINKVQMRKLGALVQRGLKLADEKSLSSLFDDCSLGAIPAVGLAYQMETIVDDELLRSAELYLEAGDHRELIHMNHQQFETLVRDCKHGDFSAPIGSPSAFHMFGRW
ncbi:YbaK/EbsC family protein [Hahella sp. KA22]|uniref:aminoacyl-tRNA deacylase n=1 Tax=Hahella sp. KA22 TaxID=1628392 RepID=UPI000FDF2D59|nr:YbaK/EbsC family protein [Hahella sp. KA22]AZZ94931.1 YbaK/EbsC family protein [Hahella sp. KA22]QAY52575.1 YbaK/EbsC family protein [Hahella sp. KA22]